MGSIRITDVAADPLHSIPYRFPETHGGIGVGQFPLFAVGTVGLPSNLGGLLVMSDLQGREIEPDSTSRESRLLGEVVAEEFAVLSELDVLPSADSIGVLLAGDFHVDADLAGRGGKGDVRHVWRAFRDAFRWVGGVPGNHDRFEDEADSSFPFGRETRINFLDPGVVELDGIRIAGVGGIVGNPSRPYRREEKEFLRAIVTVSASRPDVLVLHEGPAGWSPLQHGNAAIRDVLADLPPMVVVCGHSHWEDHRPCLLSNGTQILNTDARAFLLCHESPTVAAAG